MNPHLSDDDLIGLLYGLGNPEGHLAGCAECSERFSAMQTAMRRARAETAGVTAVSGRMLAVQRQRILELLEHPPSGSLAWRWVPVATVALLALALFLSHPIGNSLPPPAAVTAESDAELFTDVYAMEQDVEPRAAAPIRALFQDTLFEPATPAEESQKQ